jgi:hypothetical protein
MIKVFGQYNGRRSKIVVMFFLEEKIMKKKNVCYLVSLIFVLALVSNVSAAVYVWKTTNTNGDWFTATNWTVSPPLGAPLITDGVTLHATYPAPTTAANGIFINSGNATTLEFRVGGAPNPISSPPGTASDKFGYLTMNGGTLTTTNWLMVGTDSSGFRSGEVIMNDGNMILGTGTRTNGHLYIGSGRDADPNTAVVTGILRMISGTIDAGGTFGVARRHTSGYVYLDGGTILANDFTMKDPGLIVGGLSGTAYMDITGSGKVIINGDKTGKVATYIANGWLMGNGNDYDILYDYGITNPGKTTIYVPEPTTICLLSIGALSLLRRRK